MNRDLYINRVLSNGIKNYRKKKLREKILEIKDLIYELNEICRGRFSDNLIQTKTKTIEQSYDNLTIKISNKDFIIKISKFIDNYKKLYIPLNKFDVKIFLSLWIFSAFPDIIFNSSSSITENLVACSIYIVDKINIMCKNNDIINNKTFFENFNRYINKYCLYFDLYLKEDRKNKTLESIKSYILIRKNIIKINKSSKYNDDKKIEIINMMNRNLDKIKRFVSKQIKNFDYSYVDLLVEETLDMENIIVINYIKNIEKKLDEKNYDYILSILNEIQNFIRKMNKIKDNTILEEIIDPPYIIQLIKNELLDKDTIINFGLKLSDNITLSGSVRLSEMKKEIIEKLKDKNLEINNLLANIIYINLESIYQVLDEILSFQELVNELEITD
jgi:hypothetical protein